MAKIKIISFFIFILIAIFLITNSIQNNFARLSMRGFNSICETIGVNLEFKNKLELYNIPICYNNFCKNMQPTAHFNSYFSTLDRNDINNQNEIIKNISIYFPIDNFNYIKNINSIDIYIGTKHSHLESSDLTPVIRPLVSSQGEKEFLSIDIALDNSKGILNNITTIFLSFFHNPKYFTGAYFFLFLSFLIFYFNKEKIKFRFNHNLILVLIILLSIFLRMQNILYHPLWIDEIYTKTVAISSFISIFQDAGNPPLFYFIEFIFTKIFGNSDFALRFMPLIFGVLFVYGIYLIFEKSSKNLALFASFLASINTIAIYHSQEARGYSLCMALSVFSIYFLFKYIEKPTFKNLVFYFFCAIALLNSNYFLMIFGFFNFLWGLMKLDKKRDFLLANLFITLSVVPYFIISLKTALSSDFNAWMNESAKEIFSYITQAYFTNFAILILIFSIFLINLIFSFILKKEADFKKTELTQFIAFSFFSTLLCAILISIFIKPIISGRTITALYGLLFIIEIIVIVSILNFNKKQFCSYSIFALILTLLITSMGEIIALRTLDNLNNYMNYIAQDAPKYHQKGYKIYAINIEDERFLNAYPNTKMLDYINWHTLKINNGAVFEINPKDYTKNQRKTVIYVHQLGIDFNKLYPISYFKVQTTNSLLQGKIVFD